MPQGIRKGAPTESERLFSCGDDATGDTETPGKDAEGFEFFGNDLLVGGVREGNAGLVHFFGLHVRQWTHGSISTGWSSPRSSLGKDLSWTVWPAA